MNQLNEKNCKIDLSIVIPIHNEENNIAKLLEEVVTAVQNVYSFEVLFVDDGSNDSSLQILKKLTSKYKFLRIIHHKIRSGQSAALLSGVNFSCGEWIVTLDGDGQNDPKDIITLLNQRNKYNFNQKLFMFVGQRNKRIDSNYKKFQSRIANTIRKSLLNDHTPDTGCGLKLFQRSLFLSFPHFDHMHRFLPALAIIKGASIISIKVSHRKRYSGISHYGMIDRLFAGIYDLFGVLWLKKRLILVEPVEINKNLNSKE